MKTILGTNIFLWALCLFASVGASADVPNLSEQQRLEFANQKYEKEKLTLTKVTLGTLNGSLWLQITFVQICAPITQSG